MVFQQKEQVIARQMSNEGQKGAKTTFRNSRRRVGHVCVPKGNNFARDVYEMLVREQKRDLGGYRVDLELVTWTLYLTTESFTPRPQSPQEHQTCGT